MSKERLCRKCGEYIPYSIIIEQKRKMLSNRKFCLKCSPYNSHNTKQDDPDRPTNKTYKVPYKNWTDDNKLIHKARVYRKALERKTKLIELSGGKCKNCGYDKCQRSLSFHHKNPEEKSFGLCLNELWSKSWKKILEEFEKCELLCLNCHGEIEQAKADINFHNYKDVIKSLEKNRLSYQSCGHRKEKVKSVCIFCKKDFEKKNKTQVYCSVNCRKIDRRKVVWPTKEELEQLLKISSLTFIGKQYGVCRKTVKRWAKNYSLI